MVTSSQPPGKPRLDSAEDERSEPEHASCLAEVSALAESLDSQDQMRLVARLLISLPPAHRVAAVEFGLQCIHESNNSPRNRDDLPHGESLSSKLWERLFDPAETSELYSAPRRFDLATIFVVTAAYSLLFGAMSAFNDYFGPVSKTAVGLLVTIVAVVQAFYKDTANPRGVSVVTGAIAQTMIMILIEMFEPRLLPQPALLVVIFCGVLGGAVSGYLAGVLVGGVFLVADALRKRFVRDTEQMHEFESDDDPKLAGRGDSP
jgi:hypothetical protein